jgi:NAD(P)-dependent dehydrogenase (short-subunit alcohol dehydrogenase family)/acyl carrier protein
VPRLARLGPASAGASGQPGQAGDGPGHDLDPDRTVLITGGTGTLGRLTARHLVESYGARHVMLTSRRGRDAAGAEDLERELVALGAQATIMSADMSDRDDVARVLAAVPTEHPLTAVVHTAGVLDDGMLQAMTPERLDTVLQPKADAAWHLHELTAHLDLTAFALFSSVAGVLGSPGQANYAAANGFLDGLAQLRRARGLPAVSVAWGLWAPASGMTAHLDDRDRGRLARRGAAPLGTAAGLACFDAALRADDALLVAARLDFGALRDQARAGSMPPLLRGLIRQPRRPAQARPADSVSYPGRLAGLAPADQQRVVWELVREQVAMVLGQPDGGTISPDQAFKEIGFDSMLAVSLRNRLAESTGIRLPVTLVFDYPTPGELARQLCSALVQAGRDPAGGQPAGTGQGAGNSQDSGDEIGEVSLIADMTVDDLVVRAFENTLTDSVIEEENR